MAVRLHGGPAGCARPRETAARRERRLPPLAARVSRRAQRSAGRPAVGRPAGGGGGMTARLHSETVARLARWPRGCHGAARRLCGCAVARGADFARVRGALGGRRGARLRGCVAARGRTAARLLRGRAASCLAGYAVSGQMPARSLLRKALKLTTPRSKQPTIGGGPESGTFATAGESVAPRAAMRRPPCGRSRSLPRFNNRRDCSSGTAASVSLEGTEQTFRT